VSLCLHRHSCSCLLYDFRRLTDSFPLLQPLSSRRQCCVGVAVSPDAVRVDGLCAVIFMTMACVLPPYNAQESTIATERFHPFAFTAKLLRARSSSPATTPRGAAPAILAHIACMQVDRLLSCISRCPQPSVVALPLCTAEATFCSSAVETASTKGDRHAKAA
jgi:hypothetical protein